MVVVGVRVDALELRLERHLDRGQLRQVAEDPVQARLVPDRLGLAGPGEDGVGERPAAVGRRVVLVEGRVAPADVVAEARRRDVEVEEDDGRVARVAERVHDLRRRSGERHRARRRKVVRSGPSESSSSPSST